MDNSGLYVTSLFAAAASFAVMWKWGQRGTGLPLPPGPKGLPLLGNALDIPRDVPMWRTFASMARKYNTDVLHLKVLSNDMIILNDLDGVLNLLEKRSGNYSDRPDAPMLNLIGLNVWNVALMGYGNQWRSCRKLLHEFLNPKVVANFDEYQRKHSHRLLLRLAESPEEFHDHIEFAVAALVMEMTYGLNIENNEDQFLRAAVEAVDSATIAMVPGKFLIDVIPMLKHIPEWFPGAGFKTFARVACAKFDLAINGPLEYVKKMMKSDGSVNPSITWSCLDRGSESPRQGYDETTIRFATATMYMAAVESTVSMLQLFLLAMALHPHVLKKAQEELDRVVGGGRLPDYSDRDNLPYLSAVSKELFRWGCPFPISVPKRATEDNTYNGYLIPAGATVIENLWAVFYDESTFPAPETYDPERFLKDGKIDPSVKDPEDRMFGSSRRICPGRFFAMRALFLNMACILALFDIEVPVGEKLKVRFNEEHILRKPDPFKCSIKPRSSASLKLLKSVCVTADH